MLAMLHFSSLKNSNLTPSNNEKYGEWDGVVLRAFAFHSYGPGLTSRPGLTCEIILSAVLVLVLVLVPAPWVFSWSSGFPSPIKTNIPNFKSTGKQWSRRTTAKNPISHSHFSSPYPFPFPIPIIIFQL